MCLDLIFILVDPDTGNHHMTQHYNDVIMGAIASQITSLTSVYSTDYWSADQRKHESSASLAFVRGIHRGPVNSPHKWPVTRKMFPFDDVIMNGDLAPWRIYAWPGLLFGLRFAIIWSPFYLHITKASDTELWCFLWSAPEQTFEQTIETPVIWYAIGIIMTSL